MDIREAEKISTLARSLKKSGLTSTLKEALKKAEEIVLGTLKKKQDGQEDGSSEPLSQPVAEPMPEQVPDTKDMQSVSELFNKPDLSDAPETDHDPLNSDEDKEFEDVFKDLDDEMIRSNEELEKIRRIKQQNMEATQPENEHSEKIS